MLSGVQQRNLERAWGRPVVDRMGLIIDIFAQRARTKEARLQVGLHAQAGLHARLHALFSGKCTLRSSSPMLIVSSSVDPFYAPHPLVAGPMRSLLMLCKKAAADHRWSWLLLSTRRPAWCAPWMLHQGSEPALERAASQRLSAQGERFRRCISMQSQGTPANFHMAQHFVRLPRKRQRPGKHRLHGRASLP